MHDVITCTREGKEDARKHEKQLKGGETRGELDTEKHAARSRLQAIATSLIFDSE
jgi:hypothetical protein